MTEEPRRRAFCPRCESAFECKPDDIGNCGCASAKVSPETLVEIAKRYEGCLCPGCLSAVERELAGERPHR